MKPLTDDEVRRGFHAEHTPNVLNTMLILIPIALALWGILCFGGYELWKVWRS
jgi:hypothetical protein